MLICGQVNSLHFSHYCLKTSEMTNISWLSVTSVSRCRIIIVYDNLVLCKI